VALEVDPAGEPGLRLEQRVAVVEPDHAHADVARRIALAAVDEVHALDARRSEAVDFDVVAVDDDVLLLPEGPPGGLHHACRFAGFRGKGATIAPTAQQNCDHPQRGGAAGTIVACRHPGGRFSIRIGSIASAGTKPNTRP
jgi:hypothetical protein